MTNRGGSPWRRRRTLLPASAVLLAAVATALVPPPPAIAADASRGMAALIAAAIVAFSLLPFLLWRSIAKPAVWTALAIAALVLGAASYAGSGYLGRTCTASYVGKAVVIGMEFSPLGAQYRNANPGLSNDELLFDAAGIPERIWSSSSIGRCRAFMAFSYFLAIPFLLVCLFAAAEAVPATILAPAGWGSGAVSSTIEPVSLRYDVFVSYRRVQPDRRFVTELIAALEADGYRVAIDERDFSATASFLLEMERCVRESRFTLAVISPRYLESGNTQEEAIITRVLDLGDRKRRLIPLIVDQVVMPAWLYGIVGIDFTRRDPLVDPYEKLKETLGEPLNAAAS